MTIPHPDYPDIDFKPAIARYDWDQTYDVLEFVHLPQGFDELMQSIGIPALELMAIDRYTPYDYLWAEEYSDYVYNFLKQFNFSPHNSIVERLLRDESNALIKDENNNNITVPAFVFSGEKYSKTAEYKVILTEGNYEITGLVYQGWKDGIIGSIPTINQASYRFTLSETNEVDLNSIINHWCTDSLEGDSQFCINSLVLSKLNGSQWQSVAVDAPSFLFYSDIADYWEGVSQTLLQYFDDVHDNNTQYAVKVNIPTIYPIQSYLKKLEKPYNVELTEIFYSIPYHYQQSGFNGWRESGDYVASVRRGDIVENSNLLIFTLERYLIPNFYSEFQEQAFFPVSMPQSQSPYEYVINFIDLPITCTYAPFPEYLTNSCYLARANNNKWGHPILSNLGVIPSIDIYHQVFKYIPDVLSALTGFMYPANTVSFSNTSPNNFVIDSNYYQVASNLVDDLVTESSLWEENPIVISSPSTSFQTYFSNKLTTLRPELEQNLSTTRIPLFYTHNSNRGGLGESNSFNSDNYYNWFPTEILQPYRLHNTLGKQISNYYPSNAYYLKYVKKRHWTSQIRTYICGEIQHKTRIHAEYDTEILYGIKGYLPDASVPLRNIIANYSSKSFQTNEGGNYSVTIEENNSVGRYVGSYTVKASIEESGNYYPTEIESLSRTPYYEFEVWTQQEWEELYSYGSLSDDDYLDYLLITKTQTEEYMVDSVRIKEIHACLGAGEFAYYNKNGNLTPYQMHIARNLDYLMKTFGLYYNPDGTLMSITTDVSIPPPNP